MPTIEWILASVLSWSGFRLDVLFVRVVRGASVLFVGLAWTISPPVARMSEREQCIEWDPRDTFDTVGESVSEFDCASNQRDVRADDVMYALAA